MNINWKAATFTTAWLANLGLLLAGWLADWAPAGHVLGVELIAILWYGIYWERCQEENAKRLVLRQHPTAWLVLGADGDWLTFDKPLFKKAVPLYRSRESI